MSLGARKDPALVGGKPSHLEWESSSRGEHRCSDRDRCLKNRLGSFLQGILTGGCWNAQEAELHINSLEMLAAFYAIKAFINNCQGISVLLCTDNMSVLTYVNRMGGTRSLLLTAQAIDLWCWCPQGKITVHSKARECHSGLPVKAPKGQDGPGVRTHHFQLCKQSVGSTSGGSLCDMLFKATSPFLQQSTGPRSRGHRCFCTELDQYPRPCTSSLVPNFTSPSESSGRPSNGGADHPIMAHTAMVPGLDLLVDYPLLLPKMEGVTRPSPNCDCPIQGLLPQLVTWRVSGRDSEQKRFQTRLSTSSCPPGETKPIQTTTQC